MRRRNVVLGLPALLVGCASALTRPYVARQDWALTVPPPPSGPKRRSGKVLLVRTVEAVPSLQDRGLKTLAPDGLMDTDFYNRWVVPPAEGVGAALRQYLAASGLFQAVLAPGSLANAALTLEAELMQLWVEPAAGRAVAELSIVLLATATASTHVLMQATERGTSPLPARADPAQQVDAQLAALAQVFRETTAALRPYA
ncbi:MAG: ABC-type transport auxiliary lipoprotein family protein [Acetobacteraceae bacterium]